MRPTTTTTNSLAATRLALSRRRQTAHLGRRPFTTTAAAARYLRPFTVSALDTARTAMEKSRRQLYAQWSQAELISRILELERPMEM